MGEACIDTVDQRGEIMHRYWIIDELGSARDRWLWRPSDEFGDWNLEHRREFNVDYPPPTVWPTPWPVWIYDKMPAGGPHDVPADVGGNVLVSERLRVFLEVHAPQQLSFYPVRVQGPGSNILGKYFVVRFEYGWDCLHPYAWDEDENGRFVAFPVLDRGRIPADGVIGGVKGFSVLRLMRDDLKQKILAAGFTGFDLTRRPSFMDDSSTTMFEHVNRERPWPGTSPRSAKRNEPTKAGRPGAGKVPNKDVRLKRKPRKR